MKQSILKKHPSTSTSILKSHETQISPSSSSLALLNINANKSTQSLASNSNAKNVRFYDIDIINTPPLIPAPPSHPPPSPPLQQQVQCTPTQVKFVLEQDEPPMQQVSHQLMRNENVSIKSLNIRNSKSVPLKKIDMVKGQDYATALLIAQQQQQRQRYLDKIKEMNQAIYENNLESKHQMIRENRQQENQKNNLKLQKNYKKLIVEITNMTTNSNGPTTTDYRLNTQGPTTLSSLISSRISQFQQQQQYNKLPFVKSPLSSNNDLTSPSGNLMRNVSTASTGLRSQQRSFNKSTSGLSNALSISTMQHQHTPLVLFKPYENEMITRQQQYRHDNEISKSSKMKYKTYRFKLEPNLTFSSSSHPHYRNNNNSNEQYNASLQTPSLTVQPKSNALSNSHVIQVPSASPSNQNQSSNYLVLNNSSTNSSLSQSKNSPCLTLYTYLLQNNVKASLIRSQTKQLSSFNINLDDKTPSFSTTLSGSSSARNKQKLSSFLTNNNTNSIQESSSTIVVNHDDLTNDSKLNLKNVINEPNGSVMTTSSLRSLNSSGILTLPQPALSMSGSANNHRVSIAKIINNNNLSSNK